MKFIETDTEWRLPGPGGGMEEEELELEFRFCKIWKSSGDMLHHNVCMLNMAGLYTKKYLR